jgi:hypothetical protein
MLRHATGLWTSTLHAEPRCMLYGTPSEWERITAAVRAFDAVPIGFRPCVACALHGARLCVRACVRACVVTCVRARVCGCAGNVLVGGWVAGGGGLG